MLQDQVLLQRRVPPELGVTGVAPERQFVDVTTRLVADQLFLGGALEAAKLAHKRSSETLWQMATYPGKLSVLLLVEMNVGLKLKYLVRWIEN